MNQEFKILMDKKMWKSIKEAYLPKNGITGSAYICNCSVMFDALYSDDEARLGICLMAEKFMETYKNPHRFVFKFENANKAKHNPLFIREAFINKPEWKREIRVSFLNWIIKNCETINLQELHEAKNLEEHESQND